MNEGQLVPLDECVPALHHRVLGDAAVSEHLGVDDTANRGEANEMITSLNSFLKGKHLFDNGWPLELAGVI